MYTAFAQVYDALMADVNYPAWADFYRQMMGLFSIREGKIAECACGTGSLTLPLYRMGFSVTGIDISPDMLWQAAQKARKEGAAIPFVKQDMCSFHLHRAMDAVLCTCDGVNYLTTPRQVQDFFAASYEALRPGGGLFFDVSTPYKLENVLGDNLMGDDLESITYLWQNHFSKKTALVDMDLCIFVKQQDGLYQRIEETQRQRAHEKAELSEWLARAGFSGVTFYGGHSLQHPGERELRWHVAALKRPDPRLLRELGK
jgi:2-polyprenyl-3-methyl-5-hydroxy-6-metoxy-1,4-benzoquinol methylase